MSRVLLQFTNFTGSPKTQERRSFCPINQADEKLVWQDTRVVTGSLYRGCAISRALWQGCLHSNLLYPFICHFRDVNYTYLMIEESEAQKGQVTCLRSQILQPRLTLSAITSHLLWENAYLQRSLEIVKTVQWGRCFPHTIPTPSLQEWCRREGVHRHCAVPWGHWLLLPAWAGLRGALLPF